VDNVIRWLKLQWDRASAIAVALVGLIAILAGWYGMSGRAYPAEQLPYIVSGGLLGLFLIGIAGTLWLSADLRDEWRKLDSIDAHMEHIGDQLAQGAVPDPAAEAASERPLRTARRSR
jgi:hypothetical protein